jgi:hypothetical protein
MARFLLIPGLLGGFLFLFWLWAIVDVILTDSLRIRGMSKGTWLFIVLLVPILGAVAWVFFGRPEVPADGQADDGARRYLSESGPIGPEDSPNWSRPLSTPSRPVKRDDGDHGGSRDKGDPPAP